MNKPICFGASKHRNSGTGSYCAHMHLLSVCSKSDPKSTRTVIDELQQHVAHRSCCWFLSKRALQFVLPAVYFECLYWSGVGVGMVLNSTLSLSLSTFCVRSVTRSPSKHSLQFTHYTSERRFDAAIYTIPASATSL